MKPKLLDLYCCAGGAGMGYSRAGFDVTGVDIVPRPNYPLPFIQGDAIEYLLEHGHEYDVVHASPPCQLYSHSTAIAKSKGKVYPDLVSPTRNALIEVGKPYIMENVITAPIRKDLLLDGTMFGLKVIRRRAFEIEGFWLMQAFFPNRNGTVKAGDYSSVFGKGSYRKSKNDAMPKHKKESVIKTWSYAMGIDWPIKDIELSEAIPPAYTKYIGEIIIEILNRTK